jgi:hypothetical protein
MLGKLHMHRIGYAIALVILNVVSAYSQQPSTTIAAPACGYSELYRKNGWAVPGIKGARKKHGPTAVQGKPGVYATERSRFEPELIPDWIKGGTQTKTK